jgi:hypothetical protein
MARTKKGPPAKHRRRPVMKPAETAAAQGSRNVAEETAC